MTASDWPQIDSSAVPADLFGGDLFGDELIDMYNPTAVVEHEHNTDQPTDGAEAEIPAILPTGIEATPDKVESTHPGAQVAMNAAAIDDGLGAFRPSTSFSDLATSLYPGAPSDATNGADPNATTAPAAVENKPAETDKETVGAPPASSQSAPALSGKKRGRTTAAPVASASAPAPAPAQAPPTVQAPTPAAVAAVKASALAAAIKQESGPASKKRAVAPKSASAPSVKLTTLAPPVRRVAPPKSAPPAGTAALCPIPAAASAKGVVVSAGQAALQLRQETQARIGASAVRAKASDDTPNPLALPNAPHVRAPVPKPVVKRIPVVVTPKTSPVGSAPVPVPPVPKAAPPPTALPATTKILPPVAKTGIVVPPPVPSANLPKRNVVVKAESITLDAAAAAKSVSAAAAVVTSLPPAPTAPHKLSTAANINATVAAATVAGTAPKAASPRGIPTTEADFKGIAQAAVTNLILNAGNAPVPAGVKDHLPHPPAPKPHEYTAGLPPPAGGKKGMVDTSTAHVTALTSSNWVAVCSGIPPGAAGVIPGSESASDKAARTARRANLTPDERAKQNRDRNREHARNTRLRKKAYVEELKRTLTELVSQRDAAELEKRHSAQRELEQREVRFRVMEEFLKLLGRNEPNVARWVAILEDGFSFTVPEVENHGTSEMPHGTGISRQVSADSSTVAAPTPFEQVLKGAGAVMADSSRFSSLLQTLGHGRNSAAAKGTVFLAYRCDRKKFLMDGCTAVLEWSASSVGAVAQGAPSELMLKGTMRATFIPATNKLISAELLFDTGRLSSQLKSLVIQVPQHVDTAANAAAEAAQVAASEADALLDSIEMPHLSPVSMVPPIISTKPSVMATSTSQVSVASSDKSEGSCDESVEDIPKEETAVATRRHPRSCTLAKA